MPKDLQELHECLAMSLPWLQLAFIHLPENDNDRSKFMVGLECEMVRVDEPCHDPPAFDARTYTTGRNAWLSG